MNGLRNWTEHNAGINKPGPFDWKSEITGDVVEWPAELVIEGEAADDSIRRYFSAQERNALELIANELLLGDAK